MGVDLVAFFAGAGRDGAGRTLDDVLRLDDERLERVHDFIQWLFPLRERSGANPAAPVLDDAAIDAIRSDPSMRASLGRSLDRMLSFFGLVWSARTIVRGDRFGERDAWLVRSHNHLRLTRMLKSLRLLGDEASARALYDCLVDIAADEHRAGRKSISAETLRYWNDVITAPV